MSVWNAWARVSKPKPQPRHPRPYSLTAGHIRGRVFLIRPAGVGRTGLALWGMEVVNTSSGQVIASDNCTVHETILAICEEATAAARATWFWSYTPKKVRA